MLHGLVIWESTHINNMWMCCGICRDMTFQERTRLSPAGYVDCYSKDFLFIIIAWTVMTCINCRDFLFFGFHAREVQ